MSFATVYSRALLGVEAAEVTVEAHLSAGMPGFALVGLPETAVKESKERVRSAIINSGLEFPQRRLTVNLAPADIPKSSGRYDFAIALSILAASGQISLERLGQTEILGELALDGSVRSVRGVLPAILQAKKLERQILLPAANTEEMMLAAYSGARCVDSLQDYYRHITLGKPLRQHPCGHFPRLVAARPEAVQETPAVVKGQLAAKRAIQIAAAGGHNLLMIGPPGCGKTLLAEAMVRLLPPLSESEALEVASINSVANRTVRAAEWHKRPIRSPHHSATAVALVGGGKSPNPGEISLAHRGVLFLDELTEFRRGVLESLREPLESGEITVSRANYRVVFPAKFQLLAAMNPCPCGHANNPRQECRCTPDRISSYLNKLSGPLLDRIDMIVEMPGLSQAELLELDSEATNWAEMRRQIGACRARQCGRQTTLNCFLGNEQLDVFCKLNPPLRRTLAEAMDKLALSARAVHRLLRVARTIADYAGSDEIARAHLLEALAYRSRRVQESARA